MVLDGFRLVIGHSLPMYEFLKKNIGKLPVSIKEMQIDDEDSYLQFESEEDFVLEFDEDELEFRVANKEQLDLAVKTLKVLVGEGTSAEEHPFNYSHLTTKFKIDDLLPDDRFDHLLKNDANIKVQLLGFELQGEQFISRVTLFATKDTTKVSCITFFELNTVVDLDVVLLEVLMEQEIGLRRSLESLFER